MCESRVLLLVVALALPLDVHKICDTGLINKDWQECAPNKSVVCESHVAIVSRKGNPKNVKSWSDLTRWACFSACKLCKKMIFSRLA